MTEGYTITFQMVMAIVLTLGGTLLTFFVKRWISDSDKTAKEKDDQVRESFKQVHELLKEKDDKAQDALKLVNMRADKLRDQRELDMEKVHGLELALVGSVKREEMTELLHHIDNSKDEIIKAILSSSK